MILVHMYLKKCYGSHSCRVAISSGLNTTGINDIVIGVCQHEMCLSSYQAELETEMQGKKECVQQSA